MSDLDRVDFNNQQDASNNDDWCDYNTFLPERDIDIKMAIEVGYEKAKKDAIQKWNMNKIKKERDYDCEMKGFVL